MSATLGEGGELERIFGCKTIQRIPSPEGWEKQGIGRRLFAFPMRNFEEAEALELANKWIDKPKGSNHRCLILTQSERECLKVKKDIEKESFSGDYKFVDASFIESSKKEFIETDKAIALLANRYDGIDFLADDCRYLILYGLPDAANLQEKFLIERLNSKALLKVRILTKVTQAVGRCTRSATDWSLVTVIGQNINNYFMQLENRKYFHPELLAEIEFGIEQSDVNRINEFSDNIDLFLNQSKEWREAENDIIELRNDLKKEKLPCTDILEEIVNFEIKYQEYLWGSEFEKAVDEAKKVLTKLNSEELRGYRAWWLYLAGNAAYSASNNKKEFLAVAKNFYDEAGKAAKTLSWLKKLTEIFGDESNNNTQNLEASELSVIDRLEQMLNNLYASNRKKFNTYKDEILKGLSDNSSAGSYESAQKKLGDILGYNSFIPEKKEQGAPDCWWILDQKNGLVFEDNNEASDIGEISKNKALQALGHIKYLKARYQDIDFAVVLCSNKSKISDCALVHVSNENIYYLSLANMQAFAKKALNSIEKLNASFVEIGNNDWRNKAVEVYLENKLFPVDVLGEFRSMPLAKLNEAKESKSQQENVYT
jgi:Rad3-related DNA helicase